MIYLAKDLLARLTYLTLAGQDEEGRLEFIGTQAQWEKVANIENYE